MIIYENQENALPRWLTEQKNGGYRIDELSFVVMLKQDYGIRYIGGQFYDDHGLLCADKLRHIIQKHIGLYFDHHTTVMTDQLFKAVKYYGYEEPPVLAENEIHCLNAHLTITGDGQILPLDPIFSLHRMHVLYDRNAPVPALWTRYLHDLLEDEDIPTLQEFLGYCLVPTTKAQKALFLIGSGGEGKSRLTVLLHRLFGDSMVQDSLQAVQENRFTPALLAQRLLFLDDDLQTAKLQNTGTFKTLVTAETSILVERKGVDKYPIRPYCRFLGLGNQPLGACYDHSEGFYRRLLVLRCKPVSPERINDPALADALCEELPGIFNWMLEGLLRLRRQRYRFTVSDASQAYLAAMKQQENNIEEFLSDRTMLAYDPTFSETSANLKLAYQLWCRYNAATPLSDRTLFEYLKEHQEEYGLSYRKLRRGKIDCRGYRGVRILPAIHSEPLVRHEPPVRHEPEA